MVVVWGWCGGGSGVVMVGWEWRWCGGGGVVVVWGWRWCGDGGVGVAVGWLVWRWGASWLVGTYITFKGYACCFPIRVKSL